MVILYIRYCPPATDNSCYASRITKGCHHSQYCRLSLNVFHKSQRFSLSVFENNCPFQDYTLLYRTDRQCNVVHVVAVNFMFVLVFNVLRFCGITTVIINILLNLTTDPGTPVHHNFTKVGGALQNYYT